MQFSGLRLVAFSATSFQVIAGEKGDGNGHCCQMMRSRRRNWDHERFIHVFWQRLPCPGDDLFQALCGLRLLFSWSGFGYHVSPVSTAPENTVLIDYFSKITDLIAISSCPLAGSG